MFTAHATEFAANPVFRLNLVLITATVLNAAAFHQWPFKSVARWNLGSAIPSRAKTAAVLSLLLWTGALSCGRLLAYF